MRTLLLINKLGNIQIYCPFCKIIAYHIEEEDYVACNCLFWCDKCNEIMICPKGLNYEKGEEFENLLMGIVTNECTKLLNRNSLMDIIHTYDYTIPLLLNKADSGRQLKKKTE